MRLTHQILAPVLACLFGANAWAQVPSATAASLPPSTDGDCITFGGLPAGTIPSALMSRGGLGPVLIDGTNPNFGPRVNAAVIFDSRNPTGQDFDLGTPNEDFGGPGIGDAGRRGSPFANKFPLGKLLIVGENLVDSNNDGLVDDPDDADLAGAALDFDFSAIAPVEVNSITFIDQESKRPPTSIDLFDQNGVLITTVLGAQPGDNGVAEVSLGDIGNVWRMRINVGGSGAYDNL